MKKSFVSILLLLICVFGLTGCGKSEAEIKQEQEAEKQEQEAEEELRVQATVRGVLKDPDSAKFGRFIVFKPESACIAVNSRNSFGGYTGEKYVSLKKREGGGEWIIEDLSPDVADSICRLEILFILKNKHHPAVSKEH